MIQRIQSVFLLIAAVAFALLFQFPFVVSDVADEGFLADKDFDVFDHIALMILAGVAASLTLISIFLFKKRKIQIRVTYLSILVGISVLITAGVMFYEQALVLFEKAAIHQRLGLYLPLIGLIMGFFAIRFIRKDDKIVKSMDRLR